MSIRQELLCRLVRPYVFHELPAWGRLYALLIGSWQRDHRWAGAAPRTIRGKLHGYEMTLDISRWSERYAFFLGRFYDLETQLLLQAFLRPGDRVCDVGANVGMITLLAARLVGDEGLVEAFEPNPLCQRRIAQTLGRNRIRNVRLHPIALGAEASRACLSVKSANTGEGTLTPVNAQAGFDEQYEIQVRTGDSIVARDSRPIALIKIDVEGFECQTLRGLHATLVHHRPLVTTEIVATHLRRAGQKPCDIFELMHGAGYKGYEIGRKRAGLRHALDLRACATPSSGTPNVLWIPKAGPFAERARWLKLVA